MVVLSIDQTNFNGIMPLPAYDTRQHCSTFKCFSMPVCVHVFYNCVIDILLHLLSSPSFSSFITLHQPNPIGPWVTGGGVYSRADIVRSANKRLRRGDNKMLEPIYSGFLPLPMWPVHFILQPAHYKAQ